MKGDRGLCSRSRSSDTQVTTIQQLERRIQQLEKDIEFLMKGRPGRKPLPILVSEPGVCGIDPSRDSSKCPDATIYRYQKGCKGIACEARNRDYYQGYRKGQDDTTQAKKGGARKRQEEPVTIVRKKGKDKEPAPARRSRTVKVTAAG